MHAGLIRCRTAAEHYNNMEVSIINGAGMRGKQMQNLYAVAANGQFLFQMMKSEIDEKLRIAKKKHNMLFDANKYQ
jgi:hypothetical protein